MLFSSVREGGHRLCRRGFNRRLHLQYNSDLKNAFAQKKHRRLAVFRLGAFSGSLLTRPSI